MAQQGSHCSAQQGSPSVLCTYALVRERELRRYLGILVSYWLREPGVYAASRILLADEVNHLLLSALLLAAEVNHLLLNALLLARFCSVGRNLVNHLLLKPIGKQDYSP